MEGPPLTRAALERTVPGFGSLTKLARVVLWAAIVVFVRFRLFGDLLLLSLLRIELLLGLFLQVLAPSPTMRLALANRELVVEAKVDSCTRLVWRGAFWPLLL